MRGPCTSTKSSPLLQQLEKVCRQQQRLSTMKKKIKRPDEMQSSQATPCTHSRYPATEVLPPFCSPSPVYGGARGMQRGWASELASPSLWNPQGASVGLCLPLCLFNQRLENRALWFFSPRKLQPLNQISNAKTKEMQPFFLIYKRIRKVFLPAPKQSRV